MNQPTRPEILRLGAVVWWLRYHAKQVSFHMADALPLLCGCHSSPKVGLTILAMLEGQSLESVEGAAPGGAAFLTQLFGHD